MGMAREKRRTPRIEPGPNLPFSSMDLPWVILNLFCGFIMHSAVCWLMDQLIHATLSSCRVKCTVANKIHQVPCPCGAFIWLSRLCFKMSGFEFLTTVSRWYAGNLGCVRCVSVPSAEDASAWWECSVLKEEQGPNGQTMPEREPLFTSLARAQFLTPCPSPPQLPPFVLQSSLCPVFFTSLLGKFSITLCLVLLWELGHALLNILWALEVAILVHFKHLFGKNFLSWQYS